MSDRLEIRYIPLAQCILWARNPKKHDAGMIAASIETHGFKSAPRYEPALNDGQGGIGAGNGRIQVLEAMQAQGRTPPRGIVIEDGVWLVPVQFGVDAASQAAAEAYALDDNNVTLAGGEFTAVDISRLWTDDYTDLLAELANLDMLPVSVDGDDLDVLLGLVDAPRLGAEPSDDLPEQPRASLAERFGVPPFSVLDARQGYWQARKRAWIALGIQSELGRGNENLTMSHPATTATIDFYAQKRAIEAEQGREVTTDEAKAILAARGHLRDDRAQNARRMALDVSDTVHRLKPSVDQGRKRGLARTNGQDLMRGEGTNVLPGKRTPETASLKGGLTHGTTIHLYDKTGEQRNSRHAADQRSNVTGAPTLPEWAHGTGTANMASGTSIFDPVLCELVYRWFCPTGGAVLDPFAGGSVRGVVAARLGHAYTGIDLRPEQIAANEAQAQEIVPDGPPRWITGDSRDITDLAPGAYDLIFSCPPYADLEVYSDDPRDLSTMEYQDFLVAYRQIIHVCVSLLKPDRFAVFVVGDVRDKKGFYRNFVGATVDAFQDAGAILYNEAILVTQAGSLPIRIAKQFEGYRKLGKTHQNVPIFFKGDPKTIKTFGPVEMGEVDPASEFGEVVE